MRRINDMAKQSPPLACRRSEISNLKSPTPTKSRRTFFYPGAFYRISKDTSIIKSLLSFLFLTIYLKTKARACSHAKIKKFSDYWSCG